eukprot:TRINITY_DN22814_c0_g2_i2.p3 TRINITY_DN22814_c0_g2~~TRINITY_DN22814_c0_g2_i2.p3  ORF type:complete len:104 (+),score=14.50 TRINITY_DN22814_c0_g2_i2:661-972(+)
MLDSDSFTNTSIFSFFSSAVSSLKHPIGTTPMSKQLPSTTLTPSTLTLGASLANFASNSFTYSPLMNYMHLLYASSYEFEGKCELIYRLLLELYVGDIDVAFA